MSSVFSSKKNSWNVVSVASRGFCSGCGVCAGVCPAGCLEMRFNTTGEYLPEIVSEDCTQCGLCSRVCPFIDGNPDEDEHGKVLYAASDGMNHCSETGYYRNCFVGYAPQEEIRWAGSSGGMLTWTLCELLRRNEIDHVVCVHSNPDPGKLYCFNIVSTLEEVRASSKSSYYPVELSEVIQHILGRPGRYVVVGLPCVCKAIRNAQKTIPKLEQRIRFVIGLVCAGQQVNAGFAQAISIKSGLDGDLIRICFRAKKKGVSPQNYIFQLESSQGSFAETTFFDGVKEFWASGAFRLSGCNYCDDAFAECADAAFMDAWLPEYANDSAGHNIVLCRNPTFSDLLREVDTLEPIGIDQVIRSQPIHSKRNSLRARLFVGHCLGYRAPLKRVLPEIPSLKVLVKTMLQYNQYEVSRKNLAKGKAYNALRIESFPFVVIQRIGSIFSKFVRRIGR